jgi:hypothetical protein
VSRRARAGDPTADLGRLRPGLAWFWSAYFAIVALSNLTDLLVSLHVLPVGWRWVWKRWRPHIFDSSWPSR